MNARDELVKQIKEIEKRLERDADVKLYRLLLEYLEALATIDRVPEVKYVPTPCPTPTPAPSIPTPFVPTWPNTGPYGPWVPWGPYDPGYPIVIC